MSSATVAACTGNAGLKLQIKPNDAADAIVWNLSAPRQIAPRKRRRRRERHGGCPDVSLFRLGAAHDCSRPPRNALPSPLQGMSVRTTITAARRGRGWIYYHPFRPLRLTSSLSSQHAVLTAFGPWTKAEAPSPGTRESQPATSFADGSAARHRALLREVREWPPSSGTQAMGGVYVGLPPLLLASRYSALRPSGNGRHGFFQVLGWIAVGRKNPQWELAARMKKAASYQL
jgi:hypothetical protein